MKTTKFFTYAIFSFLLALASCSVEDGADGVNGMDGAQGEQGIPGQDGNANVLNLFFDASGFEGTFNSVSIPEITSESIITDVVLTYLTSDGNNWVPVPTPLDNISFNFSVHVLIYAGGLDLDYGDEMGNDFYITAGNLEELRVVIIEGSSAGRSAQGQTKEDIIQELKSAGVNINNYEEVAAYYNLN